MVPAITGSIKARHFALIVVLVTWPRVVPVKLQVLLVVSTEPSANRCCAMDPQWETGHPRGARRWSRGGTEFGEQVAQIHVKPRRSISASTASKREEIAVDIGDGRERHLYGAGV